MSAHAAEPDVREEVPPAPLPEPEQPRPAPAPTAQEQPDDAQPARVTAGPLAAMTAETVSAVGAGLWHVGGWTGVALGAAGVVGAGAAAVAGRRRTSGWRKTRSWSASSSRRAPASFGRGSSARSGRAPSLGGGAGRRAGTGSRAGSRTGGMPKRAGGRGFPGAGKRLPGAGRGGAAGRRAAALPVVRGTGRGARRAMRATGSGLDRAAAGASRGRAAARAARQAMRSGGTPRAAGRAARAALKDARRAERRRGAWRRMLGSLTWGAAGWTYGQFHAWSRSLTAALAGLFALRRGDLQDGGTQRPRINDTVDRPADPAAGRHDGGADMGKQQGGGAPRFVHAAEELAEAFRTYEPPPGAGGMVTMYRDVGMLPDVMDLIAQGINILSDRCRGELPLHPAIAELVGELAKVQSHMASVAAEIPPAIERLHEPEMTRARAPRPSEDRWNVA